MVWHLLIMNGAQLPCRGFPNSDRVLSSTGFYQLLTGAKKGLKLRFNKFEKSRGDP